MTDVKGDSKNLWKLYDVKTSQKYLRITKKKEERLLNSLFMEALFISNTVTFYPLPSFSSNRPLFAMCLRMNIEVGIMPSSLVCKPPDSRTTVGWFRCRLRTFTKQAKWFVFPGRCRYPCWIFPFHIRFCLRSSSECFISAACVGRGHSTCVRSFSIRSLLQQRRYVLPAWRSFFSAASTFVGFLLRAYLAHDEVRPSATEEVVIILFPVIIACGMFLSFRWRSRKTN